MHITSSSHNDIANTRPPCLGLGQCLLFHKFPPPGPNIHIAQLNPARPIPELINNYEQCKHRKQDIVDHKVFRAEWVEETRVPLEEDEEDIGRK